MVQFLNATQTFGEIQSIINQASNRSSIVMISPYIKVNDLILSRLIDAGRNRNVRITMICREDDLKAAERARLEQIPNLILVCDEHVHAKCFFNDECMVIGSLNLYDSTAGINHEMGVLLRNDREGDREAFQAAKNEAQFIIRNAQIPHEQKLELEPKIKGDPEISQKPNGSKKQRALAKSSAYIKKSLGNGHCIRCGANIPFELDAPYCPNCYKIWAKYKDENYKEKYCIKCGKLVETSMKYPRCLSCYQTSNK